MDRNNPYFKQVSLLVRVLPIVEEHRCFALKGGTAINLFVRDLPRLSVDIDLAYIPLENRETSLENISRELLIIKEKVEQRLGARVDAVRLKGSDKCIKLNIALDNAMIKIEVTPVLRGSVYPCEVWSVRGQVEAHFGFAEMPLLSFDDLYAGKICAALDRQHARDWFDIKLLLEIEGISENMKRALLVYMIASNRPMAELLEPHLIDIQASYATEFEDMVTGDVTIEQLEQARRDLLATLKKILTQEDKEFLLSVKRRAPQWDYLGLDHISQLPAIRWKMHNLAAMDEQKHQQAIERLEAVLFG